MGEIEDYNNQIVMPIVHKQKKRQKYFSAFSLLVTQLGFEPRTPSLKGMCSTC